MHTAVNRRIREKAVVLGLPAERFLLCLGLMGAPVLLVVFVPLLVVVWLPWAGGVYWLFRNQERLKRRLSFGRELPLHLKNR
ncbi:type VI secretion protein [Alistipes communis]|uniref:type VI secretion protein n=1 Tax=Alistipes communis TaxID=2585118 RepID=UPI003AB4E707